MSDAKHQPITTLDELDALDLDEVTAGYTGSERGDPEPGLNHSRSYHHGWRMAQMDMGALERTEEHMRLVRAVMDWDRVDRGEKPKGPWGRAMLAARQEAGNE